MIRLLVAAGVAVVGLSGCGGQRWESRLASVDGAGTDSGDRSSFGPILTAESNKVVFWSYASNLGPTDTNQVVDIYVRDLAEGVTDLVSVNARGTDSGNGESMLPEVSRDGTKVLFHSRATDLVALPSGGRGQVYVRDLVADTTTLVSVNEQGTAGGSGSSDAGRFSPDGTKVVFSSDADDIAGPSVTSGLFERDLVAGTTTRLTDGRAAAWGYSPAGDEIAFFRDGEVWRLDRATGTETAVSAGRPGTSEYAPLTFSHDGRRLAFPRSINVSGVDRTDILVHDRTTGTVTLATPAMVGAGGANRSPTIVYGFHPSNADRLLFSSRASNLVTNDGNATEDVFVRDLAARTTTLVSLKADGSVSADRLSTSASWVGDGGKVAFVTMATDLGPRDTNLVFDVYVRDLAAGTNTLVSTNAAGDNAANSTSGRFDPGPTGLFGRYELSVSADGKLIAFGSDANDLGPTDTDGTSGTVHDVYVANLVTPPPS